MHEDMTPCLAQIDVAGGTQILPTKITRLEMSLNGKNGKKSEQLTYLHKYVIDSF